MLEVNFQLEVVYQTLMNIYAIAANVDRHPMIAF